VRVVRVLHLVLIQHLIPLHLLAVVKGEHMPLLMAHQAARAVVVHTLMELAVLVIRQAQAHPKEIMAVMEMQA
jgi:hypothetical protein